MAFDPAQAAMDEAVRQQQAASAYGAYDEYRQRLQLEADREFDLKKRQFDIQKQQLAISQGQAKAEQWYQRQMVQLSKDRLAQELQIHQMDLAEQQRQFNVTSSGYLESGRPTLQREQFQNQSLFDWTKQAIDLASRPQDWVKYLRYTTGVGNSIASIPGLSWAAGGQVGNTTAQGEHPTNSLQNVLGNLGVNVGQPSAGAGSWASQAAQQANQIASSQPNLTPDQRALYQTANEFAAQPQGAAPGWYENLDPLTRDLLQGAAEAQGHDWAEVLSRFRRSRWGGGGSAGAA